MPSPHTESLHFRYTLFHEKRQTRTISLYDNARMSMSCELFRIGLIIFFALIKNCETLDIVGVRELLKIGASKIACLNPKHHLKQPEGDAILTILGNGLSLSFRGT